VVRACADERIESVVVASAADTSSAAALMADRMVCIGPAAAADSYLDIDRIMAAAIGTGCDAIHPGYGFLAERPELADECEEAGITLIGPSAEVIRQGGDKIRARTLAADLGISVGSGSSSVEDLEAASRLADSVGYPILLKAAAGGGGRGMVRVTSREELLRSFETASSEAQQAFGDGRIYLERFIGHARHVEVQILADSFGSVIHLGTRDCSVQRRYQKMIEEGPAVAVDDSVLSEIQSAAIRLGQGLAYLGAGTVEFIVDVDTGFFSFLEINTRVQVEHPVTEMLSGIDIVREQLRIAAGRPLSVTQDDVQLSGHVIECRLNCEDTDRGFLPSPGLVSTWMVPAAVDVRVDTHMFGGYSIPPYYDSLMAKLLVRGHDRTDALERMHWLLRKVVINGPPTNLALLMRIVESDAFAGNRHHTRWLEEDALPLWLEEGQS
jgi:acetyl-CoA carboxylase biotin carboxylase subunit